ncbi:CHAT domain-containing protein [Humibacillus xanthopallidus]|uniref:CHAT domain-containing protein n=1 Tax=Humibacillus xanthopallidus TaxID=412689 RepID=A0A543HGH1_9MICO|nr:CHAT domain-containing protein [Humibacillus xanthopallidus]TQM57429.1 CHAT domain-containing protein [Humibacillus xanthopallidus]
MSTPTVSPPPVEPTPVEPTSERTTALPPEPGPAEPAPAEPEPVEPAPAAERTGEPVEALSGQQTVPAPASVPSAPSAPYAPSASDDEQDPDRLPTIVRVSHGDLRFARHHVLVGHYPGGTLIGAEAALDDLLDGRLSRAAVLGIYPGPLETCQIFTDPEEWTRPPGAIVAGMGPVGTLSAASLARAVAHAALTSALANLTVGASAPSAGVTQLQLSSLLIGTGPGGLPVRDSVQALLTGIQRANDRLADTDLAVHIAELEIIELWQDRALQAVGAVGSSLTSGELADSFSADLRLEERPGRQRRLVFEQSAGWWQQVRVRTEDDGGLTFEAAIRRAGAPTRTVPTQRALVDRLVESLVDSPSPDSSASRTLFELLFPNELKAQAPDTDNLVLVVDQGSAHYPWELLDDHATEDDRVPLGVRRGLVRQLEGSSMRSHVLSATGDRALVIGDTASGLTALPAAQKEAKDVGAALRNSGFRAEPLIAESGTKIIQSLFDSAYRVVHLAGHGVYDWPLGDGTDARVTGMVLGNGMYLTAGEIGQMRQVPELVVVNCCHLGAMGGSRPASPGAAPGTASGRTSGNFHRLAASIATELIDIGVRAVVACGWAVDDKAASTFATTFYTRMLAGLTFGEAIAAARWQTWSDHQSVNTWGAYQCYGDPEYRLAPDAVVHRDVAQLRPATPEQARVEIENLSQSVDISRNSKVGIQRLQQLYDALPQDDRDDDALEVLLARTYTKFGDARQATEHFQRTLERGGLALTVRDFEVWIDQMVRLAATTIAQATTAKAMTGATKGATATGTPASRAQAPAPADVDEAVASIERAIARLQQLLEDPGSLFLGAQTPPPTPAAAPTATLTAASAPLDGADGSAPSRVPSGASVDRLWRVASAYKLLALVTCPERPGSSSRTGDWSRTQDALTRMAQWFDAARSACGPTDRRRLGALSNWLAAELALRWRPVPGREPLPKDTARSLISQSLAAAREEAHLSRTFWTVAVYADLTMLDALWGPRASEDEAREALGLYRRASEIGSEEQLQQVRDQVSFLVAMAGTEARGRARFLQIVHDGLAAIDADLERSPADGHDAASADDDS